VSGVRRGARNASDFAEYFRQSFAVDVHAPTAPALINREIETWAAAQGNDEVQAGAMAGCRVVPEPTTPVAERKATVIFQIDEHDKNNNAEWILYLLNDGDDGNSDGFSIKEVVWDGRFNAYHDHAIIVYHTESCENDNMPLMDYLRGYDERNLAYGVIHLHDERIDGCRSHYPMSRFILRNNGHPTFFRSRFLKHHILEIPIGPQNGVSANDASAKRDNRGGALTSSVRPPGDRRYIWSWIGDSGSKPHRYTQGTTTTTTTVYIYFIHIIIYTVYLFYHYYHYHTVQQATRTTKLQQ
jgi:hypothetical protein